MVFLKYKSKALDCCYTGALGEGKKAQACLDEAFRVLEPHRDMLPITLLGDYDALRSSGVHQISKVYHLLYNGNPHANTIRREYSSIPCSPLLIFQHHSTCEDNAREAGNGFLSLNEHCCMGAGHSTKLRS